MTVDYHGSEGIDFLYGIIGPDGNKGKKAVNPQEAITAAQTKDIKPELNKNNGKDI